MKRITITLLIIIIPFFYFILKDYKLNVIPVIKDENNINVFVYEKDVLIGVNASVCNDKYIDAINYLTINSNALRCNTKTYLNYDTKLIDYKINDNTITLNFNEDLINSNEKAIAQIYLTYIHFGFDEIYINVNGNKLDYFNEINISDGKYNEIVNGVIKCNDILLSKRIIIYNILENNEVVRKDYIVNKDTIDIDFILKINDCNSYNIIDNVININGNYSNNYIESLKLSLKSNMLNEYIINIE